ncbi:MAG TPA: hypothetical protein VGM23_18315, partial [Armatimonadota bacterium]
CEVTSSLCTSTELVRAYIRETMRELFTSVPDLAGVINIFCGERGTTCWHDVYRVQSCPRCRERSQVEVLAEDLNQFAEGIFAAKPSAKLLAWTYSMDTTDSMTQRPIDPVLDIITRTHPNIVWLGNFEHGGEKVLGGTPFGIHEYSLSYIGPSAAYAQIAHHAQRLRRRAYAKVQIGTTYELSSQPYIPVPGIVYDKYAAMQASGVSGAMVSWIIGGSPSPMLKAAGNAAFAPLPDKETFLRRLAGIYWGENNADAVAEAWEAFATAFQHYPCDNHVFYFGPITRCPAYHLHLEREPRTADPYNFGLDDDRRLQPFEDQYDRWHGQFTIQEVIDAYRAMATRWETGVDKLRAVSQDDIALRKQFAVAAAIHLQVRSAVNVIEFYLLRDLLGQDYAAAHPAIIERMRKVALDDILLAEEMKRYQEIDPAIGFESELYAYSFSPALLDAKIAQVKGMLKTLARWSQLGVELDLFSPIAAPTPCPTPIPHPAYQQWLRWGE